MCYLLAFPLFRDTVGMCYLLVCPLFRDTVGMCYLLVCPLFRDTGDVCVLWYIGCDVLNAKDILIGLKEL